MNPMDQLSTQKIGEIFCFLLLFILLSLVLFVFIIGKQTRVYATFEHMVECVFEASLCVWNRIILVK